MDLISVLTYVMLPDAWAFPLRGSAASSRRTVRGAKCTFRRRGILEPDTDSMMLRYERVRLSRMRSRDNCA